MPEDASATATKLDGNAIIVNYNDGYNDGPRLGPLLDLLLVEIAKVVVVDNGSSDGSERAAAERPAVTLIRNERNRGYAPAANQGAAEGEGAWLVFVNPDAQLRLGDIGAHVPVRYHGRWGPWLASVPSGGDVALDWVSSALLAVRRDAFEEVGHFAERFFLNHEDVDFGRRLRESGRRVFCRTSLLLFHEVATGNPERRTRQSLLALEPDQVVRRHDGRSAVPPW